MRQKLVAGNWKMNGSRLSVVNLINDMITGANQIHGVELAVFPPFIYLDEVEQLLSTSEIAWGAQNVCDELVGAYTGEVSAAMLAGFACKYVIIGHSERRHIYGESEHMIAKKFAIAEKSDLKPILCVGETLQEKEAGKTMAVIHRQLEPILALGAKALASAVIAYEPVWAIGTGKTATPDYAQDIHAAIREKVALVDGNIAEKIQILYGGSVKPDNAKELFTKPDIDGGLIGGASLEADKFLAIAQAAM